MYLVNLARRLRQRCFPTERERMVARWKADDGEGTLRVAYPLDAESLVLDVGGYLGQWTSDLFGRYLCRFVSFEPVAEYADALERRFAHNPRIRVVRAGLGGESRRESIAVSDDASSIHGRSGQVQEVEIIDVAEWLAAEGIELVHLCKINIEGAEYELLERLLDAGLVGMFDDIQVQFHDIGPGSASRMERIQRRLCETHHPTYQYRFVWENWRRNS
jgi:FkbM family methyltransferase